MSKLKIEDVVEQLEFANESNKSFFNKKTGEIHLIPEEVGRYAEQNVEDDDLIPEWEKKLIPISKDILNNLDDYIQFPDQFYVNEYSIMEKFCLNINDEELRDKMYSSIKGSGAFQRFKNNIHHFGIADDWYKYKDEVLKELAIEWCEENKIEYY